tara:strand:- start:1076 stop:1402 length:327 start_codon:yes stop_codon:yes gene_type:complete
MAKPFVPINDVADHFSVSISTVRAWVRGGDIPKNTYVKVGNTYRFNIDAVSDALTGKEEPQEVGVKISAVEVEVADIQNELGYGDGYTAHVNEGDLVAEEDLNLDDDI